MLHLNNKNISRSFLLIEKKIFLLIIILFFLFSCSIKSKDSKKKDVNIKPQVFTADIQEGIIKHINDQIILGNGYFKLLHEDKVLLLKLVRIHTEYLATLSPKEHFACVDLADVSGDVYDVDFFLKGDAGSMIVTETMTHKLNGQPYYVWEQKPDKTWGRVSMDKADRKLLGIITEKDSFEFVYKAYLPDISNSAKIWLPMPSTDAYQKVKLKSVSTPQNYVILDELAYGNKILYMELSNKDSGKIIEITYDVERIEKSPYTSNENDSPSKYLKPESLVPKDENFQTKANEVVSGKNSDLERARALYDHVIDRIKYIKNGTGWGKGDAVYACNAGSGNCTDFHSYFIALARAIGIPSRFAIGASIPSERNDGGIDGYHCWAEFYADNKWWPVDISEADKFTGLSSYYFGHHPSNRIEFSKGKDLIVENKPSTETINFLAYPLLEINEQPEKVKTEFLFTRKT